MRIFVQFYVFWVSSGRYVYVRVSHYVYMQVYMQDATVYRLTLALKVQGKCCSSFWLTAKKRCVCTKVSSIALYIAEGEFLLTTSKRERGVSRHVQSHAVDGNEFLFSGILSSGI